MSISHYIKEIGRGRDGARALNRAQAADLMGQILDGMVTDLELGAFCLAMRIKGETPEEMAGFLDATHTRLHKIHAPTPVVVLPSYNGARKLPVLTPLLAHLLAREGLAVVIHGTATETARITSQAVLQAMGQPALAQAADRPVSALQINVPQINAPHINPAQATSLQTSTVQAGQVVFAPTEMLHLGLKRLLDVRRVVGLRNPGHSLVKLMNPTHNADALLISSYTHPEYARSMTATFGLTGARALLLRGTEGEVVADARRTPQMTAFLRGTRTTLVEAQTGPLLPSPSQQPDQLPELPTQIDAASTARYIQRVLEGALPVPTPLATQVQAALKALRL